MSTKERLSDCEVVMTKAPNETNGNVNVDMNVDMEKVACERACVLPLLQVRVLLLRNTHTVNAHVKVNMASRHNSIHNIQEDVKNSCVSTHEYNDGDGDGDGNGDGDGVAATPGSQEPPPGAGLHEKAASMAPAWFSLQRANGENGRKELALKRLYGDPLVQDQRWVPTPTEGLLPGLAGGKMVWHTPSRHLANYLVTQRGDR